VPVPAAVMNASLSVAANPYTRSNVFAGIGTPLSTVATGAEPKTAKHSTSE
jgi:hypothetical protein